MRFEIGELPETPLTAAAAFHTEVLPLLEHALIEPLEEAIGAAMLEGDDAIVRDNALPSETGGRSLLLIFTPADHTHHAWRVAVVQSLAREHAPFRVNAVASEEPDAIAAAEHYCAAAPGVTGQYWSLDGNGAGSVLS
jgi:hypothetical protein